MGVTHPAQTASVGLGSTVATRRHVLSALVVVLFLGLMTAAAARFQSLVIPPTTVFLPVAATIWALADFMTAFFLVSQFYVNGRFLYAVLSAAYTLSGALTIPYVMYFPGVFGAASHDAGVEQISLWCWFAWKCAFPIIVAVAVIYRRSIRNRLINKRSIASFTALAVFAPLLAAAAYTAIVIAIHSHLPIAIRSGHFEPLFTNVMAPAICVLNLAACALLLIRPRRLRALDLWIAIAMISTSFDGILNSIAASRYSLSWYTGKVETIVTSSVVLIMLLTEVVAIYRRLSDMATIDPLTELANRRLLEEHADTMLEAARRSGSPISMLVIDVDFFKLFNDTYGHAAGDTCLRRIAKSMASDVSRPFDLVARFGGEEFVVLLPDTPAEGAMEIAKRMQRNVEALNIPHTKYDRGHVTVSVGIGVLTDARLEDPTSLFELADAALFAAKGLGRNAISMRSRSGETSEKRPPLRVVG